MKEKIERRAVIDFFILLAVILAVSLLISSFVRLVKGKRTDDSSKIEYTVRIAEVREDMSRFISEGDEVIDSVGKRSIGHAGQVSVHPSTVERLTDGIPSAEKIDGYVDIYVTVTAMASIQNTDITVGGYNLKIGRVMYLRFPDFTATAECVRISEVQNEA